MDAAISAIETMKKIDANILIQEFISESRGEDIRAIVVGDEVVASMKRKAKPGEFRSNVHLGGSVEKYDLTEQEEESAIKAAKVLGLSVAGVDLIQSDRGPLVLEVNSSPGLEGIEKASEIPKEIKDSAKNHIIKNYAKVNFDLDYWGVRVKLDL